MWQMADDQESARQAVIEASIGSAQRLAMRIIYLPKDRREAGLETVRRIFSEELRKRGYDDQSVQRWLELQIEGIRRLISEIEASGGGRDGNT
jgi:hypothetical protein